MSEISHNQNKYEALRGKYPEFSYESFSWEMDDNALRLEFHFHLNNDFHFRPRHTFKINKSERASVPASMLDTLAFHIGMVELVSYWKAACAPRVVVKPFGLNEQQQQWWKKLYFHGLGEFFYLNGIQATEEDFMHFSFLKDATVADQPHSTDLKDEMIIPVGGGKDSVVSLSLLAKGFKNSAALVVNPREATRACTRIAGLEDNVIEIHRTIDAQLLKLNDMGFLNGHTPFSSLLAFVSLMAAAVTGRRHIALSNEASANEATIPGTKINHQYSKSFEFENDFRNYYQKYIHPHINYFSFLRPLNELQIGALFAQNPQYFNDFKSCNAGSKTDSWCCNCPKCLFTWVMLAPFVAHEKLRRIFGEDLLEKPSLLPLLQQLAGTSPEKPFECVGTIDEVNAALDFLNAKADDTELPALLQQYYQQKKATLPAALQEHLSSFNEQHHLESHFRIILEQALEKIKIKS